NRPLSGIVHAKCAQGNSRAGDGAGACGRSIGRIPDDGEGVVVVLTGRTAEVRVELPRSEFRCREAQRNVGLARLFSGARPARADLKTTGEDAIVGLIVVGLVLV